MIKQLRYLCTLLLMAVVSAAWGDEVVYYTLDTTGSLQGTNNSYTGNCDISSDGITWNLTGNSKINPWRIGGKSITNADRTVYTKTAMGSAISKLVLTLGTGANVTINSLKLTVASDADFLNVIDEVSITPTLSADNTFSPTVGAEWAANSYYKFTFNLTISETSNKFVQFSKVTFYKEKAADAKQEAEVTIGSTTLDLNETTEVTTDGPALTLTTSDETVASVSGTTVTGVAVGTATITATWEEDDNFEAGSKNFTVTVTDPNGPGTENNPYTVAQARAAIDANEGITGVYAKGIVTEIPTAYDSGYKNITFNFVDAGGDTNFLQAFRCVGDDAENVAVGDIVVVKGNLTKYGSTYEFGQGCELVKLEKADVAVPTFTPAEGVYYGSQNVSIECETEGASVYYTTDGTEPTTSSTLYTSAIVVAETTTIKAMAVKGSTMSSIVSATYTIRDADAQGGPNNPFSVAQASEAEVQSSVFVKGIISEIKSLDVSKYKRAQYYISDNGEKDSQFYIYNGYYLNGTDFTDNNQIAVGDTVVVFGDIVLYNESKQLGQNNYIVSLNRPETPYVLPVPTFSPAAGAVDEGTVVTISVADEENVVDYLQFSYDQENWAEYTDETVITITQDTTIYARSVGTDGSYSEVASATYTIKAETPAQDVVIVKEDKTTFLFNTEGNEWGFPVGTDNKEVEERAFTANDVTIKVAGSEGNGFYYNTQGMLMLGKSGAYLTLPAFDFAVGKIEVIGKSGASGSVKQNIFVGENAVSTETTGATGTNTYVIDADYQAAGNVYTLKVTSSHNTQITQIVVYKATGNEKADPQLKFSAATATATLGSEFAAPTLSYVDGFDGTVKYESSNTEVATVDATTGEVTLVAAGEAIIKATSGETDNYLAGEASYTLTVKEKLEGDVEFKLVTSTTDLTDGEYLIVSVLDNMAVAFDGSLETLDAVSNNQQVTVTNNIIVTSENISFVITAKEGGYSIKSNSGYYIGNTSDANALKSDIEDKFVNSITFDEANANIVSSESYLRYNSASNQDRFRYYKSASYTSQQAIKLFKKISSTETVKGDVNKDDHVTIADVTALVNILLNKEATEGTYDYAAADVDGDDDITVADVEALVNLVLKQTNE